MKLTWFGGSALRLYLGGEILVCDAELAAGDVNQAELVSGADRVFRRNPLAAPRDLGNWRPRPVRSMLSETEAAAVEVHEIAPNSVLIEGPGEAPLVIAGGAIGGGRWAAEAVVVVFNPADAANALGDLRPRMLVLAFEPMLVETTVERLRDQLDGTSLVALEKSMALEV